MRSSWKPPLLHLSSDSPSTRTVVHPKLVGVRINVYNGRTRNRITIREAMVGRPLSAFILSKRTGSAIHSKATSRRRR